MACYHRPAEGDAREVRCHFCNATATMAEAMERYWVPYHYSDATGTEERGPVCEACSERLVWDANGEAYDGLAD